MLYLEHPARYEYRLTEKGADLFVGLNALRQWGSLPLCQADAAAPAKERPGAGRGRAVPEGAPCWRTTRSSSFPAPASHTTPRPLGNRRDELGLGRRPGRTLPAWMTLRPLTTADIPALAGHLAAVEAVDRTGEHYNEDDLVEEFANPDIQVGKDIVGAFDREMLVGYFATTHAPPRIPRGCTSRARSIRSDAGKASAPAWSRR